VVGATSATTPVRAIHSATIRGPIVRSLSH
jgi:hypothetical protein